VELIDCTDPTWDDAPAGLIVDPHCGRALLRIEASRINGRAILVRVRRPRWQAVYPLVLQPLANDRWLARTPEYGGPWIAASEPGTAAVELRAVLDEELAALGVVSEVVMLSPFIPHREVIRREWHCVPEKNLCIVCPAELDNGGTLSKGRRSDLSRARRDSTARWLPLDASCADEFAIHYAEHMDRIDAPPRWRRDPAYFLALAEELHVDAWIAWAERDGGGAAALLFRRGEHASYAYAVRWGDAAATPTLALWTALHELDTMKTRAVLLGGGISSEDDDPLLRFKRSWGGTTVPYLLGARVFDRVAHDAAVLDGIARPLPDEAMEP